MPVLSVPKFAAHCGVSKQAAYQALKEGRIFKGQDGVDTDHEVNSAYKQQQESKSLGEQSAEKITKKAVSDKIEADKIAKKTGSKKPVEVVHIPPSTGAVEIDGVTRPMAELIRIVRQSEKLELEMSIKRKDNIPKSMALDLFAKLQEIDNNILGTLPDRAMPVIAGIFESTDENKIRQAKKALEKEMFEALAMSQRAYDKFLKKVRDKK